MIAFHRFALSVLLALMGNTASGAVYYRVACGGPGGAGWVADTPFVSSGLVQAVSGQAVPYDNLGFAGPGVPLRHVFPTSTATKVTLAMLEPRLGQTAGQRIFSISINGTVVSANLDLFASVGALKPVAYSFPVPPYIGQLTVTEVSSKGNSVCSGLTVEGPEQPRPVMMLTGPDSARPSCPGPVAFYVDPVLHHWSFCDGVAWPPSDSGLEADMPACDGKVDFYWAIDSKALFVCVDMWRRMGGTTWGSLVK